MKVYIVGLGKSGSKGIEPLAVFEDKEKARCYILQFLAPQESHMISGSPHAQRWDYSSGQHFIEWRECDFV